jgi:hypothetical protein
MLEMLWGPPRLDETTKARVKTRIANLLHDQLSVLTDAPIEDSFGELNRKAVGYVFGFASAYLKARCRLEPSYTTVAITSDVLETLFSRHSAAEYNRFLMRNLNDRLVVLGKRIGSREFEEYLDSSNATPVGLGRIILKRELADAE